VFRGGGNHVAARGNERPKSFAHVNFSRVDPQICVISRRRDGRSVCLCGQISLELIFFNVHRFNRSSALDLAQRIIVWMGNCEMYVLIFRRHFCIIDTICLCGFQLTFLPCSGARDEDRAHDGRTHRKDEACDQNEVHNLLGYCDAVGCVKRRQTVKQD